MEEESTYDIIVVGAGTAGSVIANRLSAYPEITILVLEAGSDRNDDPKIYTPGLAPKLLDDEDYSWPFTTEPESGLKGRTIKHPRGKAFGGTSAINSFALIYPSRVGIDAWRDLGNQGWAWDDLQSSFEKFQSVCEPSGEVRRQLALAHGEGTAKKTDGPLQASFPSKVQPLQRAWIEAWQELGLESQGDALHGDAIGGHTSTCHITAESKERSHAGVAFLKPAMVRKNLTIISEAEVDKVLFSESGSPRAATAVQYTKHGTRHFVHATKEIILAAGTFASPALLERSGIGNCAHLSTLGIPVVHHNAAVGENLQDHIRGGISFEAAGGVPTRSTMPEHEARELYERDRTGPLADWACYAFAYMPLLPLLNSSAQEELLRTVELELAARKPSASEFEAKRNDFIASMLRSPSEAVATAFLSRKPAIAQAADSVPDAAPTNWITLFAMLSHSLSRGSVHITSLSPSALPKVECGYYSDPLDLEIHARCLQALEKTAASAPLAAYIKPHGKRLPALSPGFGVDEAKECLRAYATTNYHPVGTCAMMPEAMDGVVDPRLKVYGTKGLRVVDASVMPVIPRGNIVTSVYAVAEKGADIVREDLGL